MRFLVLGPLEVEADNGPVVLGGQKERLLLAQLLTRPNQVVPVEALVGGLWGEHPPPTAAKTCSRMWCALAQARVVISDWKADDNHRRRHSALGCQAPAARTHP